MSSPRPHFSVLPAPESCPLFVELAADNGRPLLFLVHGFMMSRAIWDQNVAVLSEHFRIARIELLGHGRAAAPNDPDLYEMTSYIEAIDEIRRDLGAVSCAFCAHSFGAGIALSYGLAYPQFTSAIVFTNSRSALGTLKSQPGDLQRMTAALRDNGEAALRAFPFHPKHMTEIRPSVQVALVKDAELISPIGIANAMSVTARASNLFDRLADLLPPALLINGRREHGFQAAREQLAAQYKNIEIHDFDAGHSVNAEMPEAFNAAALEFLRRATN